MRDTLHALILDLLDWIGPEPRPYAEVIAAWRTSCPRLPVWEEVNDRGFLELHPGADRRLLVSLSVRGREHLLAHRPVAPPRCRPSAAP